MSSWGLLLSINMSLLISLHFWGFPSVCHWSYCKELHCYSGITAKEGTTPLRSSCTKTLTVPLCLCFTYYAACLESKDTSRVGQEGNFLCLLWQHCHQPWSFTCELCSFDSGRTSFVLSETRLKWQRRCKVPLNVRCVPSCDFSAQKVNIHQKFTNKLLLLMVTLWNSKMWRSGAVNSPKEGLMCTTNKGTGGHLWSLMTFFGKLKEKFVQINTWR